MRKEELRNLKRINATQKMIKTAMENDRETTYVSAVDWRDDKCEGTRYDALVRCQSRGSYLMIAVFFPECIQRGELTPTYEIYCNPEGDEYITRVLKDGEEQRWSEAMADNLERLRDSDALSEYGKKCYLGIEKRIWQNKEGKKTIQRFLGAEEEGIYGLIKWQRKIREQNILEAEKRQQAPWDADMSLVPAILPSFEEWMQKEAADRYFIIYEYSAKGAKEGWCSGCRRMVPVAKPRHNEETACPKCGREAKYKAAGMIQTLATGTYKAQCIQKIPGGIVVRTFSQRQRYWGTDYRTPNVQTDETGRVLLFDDGRKREYEFGMYKNKTHRFIPVENRWSPPGEESTYIYKKNLGNIKSEILRESSIGLWGNRLPVPAQKYLAVEEGNPVIEKLVKIGMFRLAAELMHVKYYANTDLIDQDATELTKMLKIDKARLSRLKKMDGNITHLKWLQYEKVADRIWPDEMIKGFGDNVISTKDFNFLHPPLKFEKIWNYLKKQELISGKKSRHILGKWRDYINMAKKAKMDVKNERIWKPKNVMAAHDELVLLLQQGEMEKQAERLEKKWPKVNSILPKLKKFKYADKKFTILAPESILDIVREGTALQHCVHTCDFYFDRIQKNETYLFFLRRSGQESVPWYTLEVEAGGNIRQKRTTGDNQNKDFDEAVEFLKKWQKVFIKRLTEEEKELGKKADQARMQEYEKLRRDGNKVWHGKLAGKLLADVLEEDFMAVM